jgi:hypothetical protein
VLVGVKEGFGGVEGEAWQLLLERMDTNYKAVGIVRIAVAVNENIDCYFDVEGREALS